ncbi:MAG: hypothetical protein Q9219_007461, partial [cf. Caloplaca sp. 3 TL-2023]
MRHLPLRDLHWNSATRPLRSIDSLHIELLKAGTNDASCNAVEANSELARNGRTDLGDYRGSSSRIDQPTSATNAKKERRHQIPGLRQTPYLKVFFIRCNDVESYKANHRKEIREWIKENTPPSQSSASINAQELHDAYEWLIVHVVLPGDGKPILHASTLNKSDIRNSYRGPDAVNEKLRGDFNGTSKTAVDRVAQVQPKYQHEIVSTISQSQNTSTGWDDFMTKAKNLILSSFDLRVTQYEEDIREKDAQRNIPGWNFNTFFVLKEGLARGFESVGLVEDALIGYQELSAGLNAIVESDDHDARQRNHFRSYTVDLSAELKRILQLDHPQYPYGTHAATTRMFDQNSHIANTRAMIGSDLLVTDRKPFRELILANDISIFDFRCYVFAREVSLLLKLACGSDGGRIENGTLTADDRSENADVLPEATESNTRDFLLLSEVCRRALHFLPVAGRMIRDDLRSSIDPLSKGHMDTLSSSISTVEGPIEDIIACWTYSACQCILDVANGPSLSCQLHALLRHLEPSIEIAGEIQGPTSGSFHRDLPQRTSSLAVQAKTSVGTYPQETFPALTSQDVMRLLPLTSTQTGLQELATQRAELVSLKRRVLTTLAHRSSNLKYHEADLSELLSSDGRSIRKSSLHHASTDTDGHESELMTLNANRMKSMPNEELSQSLVSKDAYAKAYKNQLPQTMEAQEVRVKLVDITNEQPHVLWLSTASPDLLPPGTNQIVVQTTSNCLGWYRLERIDVRSANIVFTYDNAAPASSTSFGGPGGAADAIARVSEANMTPVLVWTDQKALEAQVSLHPCIYLRKPRSLRVTVAVGCNNISEGKLSLRACSAGLRLHTANAHVQTGDGSRLTQSHTGAMEFGALDAGSELSVQIPFGLENSLEEIKVKVEISYTVKGKEFFYLCTSELSLHLPLSVNVRDNFQDQALFSNFKVETADLVPTRVDEYSVQGTRLLQVGTPSAFGNILTIFRRQPLALVAAIRRDTARLHGTLGMHSDERTLILKIRYACLDQEIMTIIEDALSAALLESQFRDLSRLLVGALRKTLRSKFTIQDLETIALSGAITLAPFQHHDWISVLDGLHPERRVEIFSWLAEWHAV